MRLRFTILILTAIVICSSIGLLAQKTGTTHEAMTIAGTAVSFAPSTLSAMTKGSAECVGVLEANPIRMTTDGTIPTTNIGVPVAVGQSITIIGKGNLQNFKAIRSSASSGTIYWECYQ